MRIKYKQDINAKRNISPLNKNEGTYAVNSLQTAEMLKEHFAGKNNVKKPLKSMKH